YISESIASDTTKMYSIAKWAIENDMTMNRFYFARSIDGISDAWANKIDNPGSADIFIFDFKDSADYSGMENLYILDGFVIGSASELPGLEEYDSYVIDPELFGGNENTEMSEGGVMVCHNGGIIYGPYITVPEGNYSITYYGDNLQDCTFDCVCSEGSVSIEITIAAVTSNEITYEISLEERTEKVEFRLFNNSGSDAVLYQVKLEELNE
ncbi:MAG: hypothetical protein LUE87_04700, partial [Lachnospiraceae bacterium]|nr:hypothetical protein [Lachnospiraceae bacterium]